MRFLNNPILQVGYTSHNIFINVLNVVEALIINLGPSMLMDENLRDSKIVLCVKPFEGWAVYKVNP
jgi:hypothetical protein